MMLNGEKGDRVQVYMYTGTGTTDKVNMWTSGHVHWYWSHWLGKQVDIFTGTQANIREFVEKSTIFNEHPLAYLIIDNTSN